jgi:hypothetical protein
MKIWLLGVMAAVAAFAQQPDFVNAKVETRALSGSLAAEFQKMESGSGSPMWMAYTVPMVPRHGSMCGDDSQNRKVYLEGPDTMVMLFRFENRALERVRTSTLNCQFDGGGLPVVLLTGVTPAQHIELLASLLPKVAQGERRGHMDGIVSGIALTRDGSADRVLEGLLAPSQTDAVREKAMFWMAEARGRVGFEAVKKVLESDASDRMREKATFDITLSREPGMVPALVQSAKTDKTPKVRSQALFWLAHKAGHEQSAVILEAARQDPDAHVRKQAVFALQQIPHGEGIPILIQLVRGSSDAEVRKQAMFWLGQSKDPQATKFFADVLK